MNGIGNAFIWAAVACGPVFLVILGIMTILLPRRRSRLDVARLPLRRVRHAGQERSGAGEVT